MKFVRPSNKKYPENKLYFGEDLSGFNPNPVRSGFITSAFFELKAESDPDEILLTNSSETSAKLGHMPATMCVEIPGQRDYGQFTIHGINVKQDKPNFILDTVFKEGEHYSNLIVGVQERHPDIDDAHKAHVFSLINTVRSQLMHRATHNQATASFLLDTESSYPEIYDDGLAFINGFFTKP